MKSLISHLILLEYELDILTVDLSWIDIFKDKKTMSFDSTSLWDEFYLEEIKLR